MNANDEIVWAPPLDVLREIGTLDGRVVHWCPMAVLIASVSRAALDPLALGLCRYCHVPLPEGSS